MISILQWILKSNQILKNQFNNLLKIMSMNIPQTVTVMSISLNNYIQKIDQKQVPLSLSYLNSRNLFKKQSIIHILKIIIRFQRDNSYHIKGWLIEHRINVMINKKINLIPSLPRNPLKLNQFNKYFLKVLF